MKENTKFQLVLTLLFLSDCSGALEGAARFVEFTEVLVPTVEFLAVIYLAEALLLMV